MKTSILHSGRLYEYQRQQQYNKHKEKISEILTKKKRSIFQSEQLPMKRKKHSSKSQLIINQISTSPSQHIPQHSYRVIQENNRLVKRLFEINRRKKYEIVTSQQQQNQVIKLSKLHKKYSEANRLRKQKQLQEQNQKLIDKLMDRRKQHSQRIREEYFLNNSSNIRENIMLKRSRSYTNNSKAKRINRKREQQQEQQKSKYLQIDMIANDQSKNIVDDYDGQQFQNQQQHYQEKEIYNKQQQKLKQHQIIQIEQQKHSYHRLKQQQQVQGQTKQQASKKQQVQIQQKQQVQVKQKYEKLNPQQLILIPKSNSKKHNKNNHKIKNNNKNNNKTKNNSTLILPQINSKSQISLQQSQSNPNYQYNQYKLLYKNNQTNNHKKGHNNNVKTTINHSQILIMLKKYYQYKNPNHINYNTQLIENDKVNKQKQRQKQKLQQISQQQKLEQKQRMQQMKQKQRLQQIKQQQIQQQIIITNHNAMRQQTNKYVNKKQQQSTSLNLQLQQNNTYKLQDKRQKSIHKPKLPIIYKITQQSQYHNQYLNQQHQLTNQNRV